MMVSDEKKRYKKKLTRNSQVIQRHAIEMRIYYPFLIPPSKHVGNMFGISAEITI
jgi:hypothetical protein